MGDSPGDEIGNSLKAVFESCPGLFFILKKPPTFKLSYCEERRGAYQVNCFRPFAATS
jgi:hypothetical protein